jgi:chitinase
MQQSIRLIVFFCLISSFADAQFRVVGYLNTWDHFPGNVRTVDFSKITHLNIAFGEVDARGDLTVIEGLSVAVKKAHEQSVKVLISLGGADLDGTGKNWKKFTDAGHMKAFCDRIVTYLTMNGLDGVDVDLEGNIIGQQYGGFIKTLSEKLRPAGKLLSAAVATWYEEQVPASCLTYFDYVNIMSFDLTGPGNAAAGVGQHAPYSMAVNDLAFWKKKGVPAGKMGLGIPFYGYGFFANSAGNEIAYKDIVRKYPGAEQKDKVGHTIYYNGIPTIREKVRLALREAGGIMIWQLTGDAEGRWSLLTAADSVIRHSR